MAEAGRENEVLDVFAKWGLDAVIVGTVKPEPRLRIRHHGVLVADIPNESLTDDAPLYHRPVGTWKPPVALDPSDEILAELNKPRDYTADLKKLLASANICSKRWVHEQYDTMVQTNTVQGPGGEAGVMRIKGTGTPGHERGLAMALDGNGRWCYLDPKLGAMHAVAEACRKVACTGATPVAATNCLNFGNPEKPEIMAQLSAAIDGISEACAALGTPITGGNVSLYNETKGVGIYPTPVIGIVGILDDVTKAVPANYQQTGDAILFLSGRLAEIVLATDEIRHLDLRHLGSSEFAKTCLGALWGLPPQLNLHGESQLQKALIELANAKLLHSARDVSDGGLAVSLAEASIGSGLGAIIDIVDETAPPASSQPLEMLFSEPSSAVVVSCAPANVAAIATVASQFGLFVLRIGETGGASFDFNIDGEHVFSIPIQDLREPWAKALESALYDEVTA